MYRKLLILTAFIILALSAFFAYQNPSKDRSAKLRICPEAWYENRMPGPDNNFEQYFIIKGNRIEVQDVDVNWVQANCIVNEPQAVY